MKQETLKDKAYHYIKSRILSCEYLPGTFLDEKKLIEEIKSSRTPIREALNKIEQENLIKIIPKKGVMITELSLKNILDIYQLREIIEPAAILKYGNLYPKDTLENFRDIFASHISNSPEFYNADDDFHYFIIEPFKNAYINNIMEEIRTQSKRLRIVTGRIREYDLTSKEHIRIIDHILNEQYDSASVKMKEHIALARNNAIEYYANK